MALVSQPTPVWNDIGRGITFSPDGSLLVVASNANGATVYKRDVNGHYQFLNTISDPGAGASTYMCQFDSSGTYLGFVGSGSPYVAIWKRTGDTLTKLTTPLNVFPVQQTVGLSFGPNGDNLSVSFLQSPFLYRYGRSGDTWTKFSDTAGLTDGGQVSWGSVEMLGNGFNALASGQSPYIHFMNGQTKITGPSDTPVSGFGKSVRIFPKSGSYPAYVAFIANTAPYLRIWKRTGDTAFSYLGAPPDVVGTNLTSCEWSPDGSKLYVVGAASLQSWTRDGDTFTKNVAPDVLPNGTPAAISAADGYVATVQGATAAASELFIYKDTEFRTAEGEVVLPAFTAAAEGEFSIGVRNSDLVLPAFEAAAEVWHTVVGDGVLGMPAFTADATVFQDIHAQGVVTLPAFTFAGEAGVFEAVIDDPVPILIAPAYASATPAAPILIAFEGAPFGGGDLVLPAFGASAELGMSMGAGGDVVLPAFTFSGSVGSPVDVTSVIALPAFEAVGEVDVQEIGVQGAVRFPAMVASGEARLDYLGSALLTLPAFTLAAEGVVENRTADAVIALPAFTFAGEVIQNPQVSTDLSLPPFTAAGVVWQDIEGNAAASFPAFTAAAVVWQDIEGDADISLPPFTAAGVVWQDIEGNAAASFPAFIFDGDVNSDHPQYNPEGDFLLPAFTAAAEVTNPHGFIAAVRLPAFSASGEGSLSISVVGVTKFPAFTAGGEAWRTIEAVGAARLPVFGFQGQLGYPLTVDANLKLPAFRAGAEVGYIRFLEGDVVFPAFVASATIHQVIEINGAMTLPMFTSSGLIGDDDVGGGDAISFDVETSTDSFNVASSISFGFGTKFP